MSTATEALSPVAIEDRIRDVANRIAKGVDVCAERAKALQAAESAYRRAYAEEFVKAEGPQYLRRYVADTATHELWEAMEVAKAAHRHATQLARALESELRAYQSIGASMREAYRVAGRGEH